MPALANVSTKSARRLAFATAILIIIETALIVSEISISRSNGDSDVCSRDEFEQLKPSCLKDEWDTRHKYRWVNFCMGIVGALGSFFLIPVILSLLQIFAVKSGSYSVLLGLFAAGAAVEGYDFLTMAGRGTVGDWIFENFDLSGDGDDAPLKALTITNLMLRGEKTWLVAMDQLLLGLGVLAVSRLTYKNGILPRWHGHLGVFTGMLGVITFCLELARFGDWRLLSIVSGIALGVFGFVMLPIWLLVIGCTLGSADATPSEDFLDSSQAQWVAHTDDDGNTGVELGSVGVEKT